MTTRITPIVTIQEDQGFTYRARLVNENGTVIVDGEIQSWDVRIYDVTTGLSTEVKSDLGKSPGGVIQALSPWSRDAVGFNFRYDFPYNYWDMVGGKTYRMEMTFWKSDGEPIREAQKLRVRDNIGT